MNQDFVNYLKSKKIKSKFEKIYTSNYWKSKETVSGEGSTIKNTRNLRKSLVELIKLLNVKTIIDAPCGDMNWISRVDFKDINYFGYDIVSELIQKNREKFSNFPNYTIERKDVLVEKLPKADLILCRDLIIHFPLKEIYKLINNFILSGSKYLLISQYTIIDNKTRVNREIEFGHFSFRNLTKPPFNFEKPLLLIPEDDCDRRCEKNLALYKLDELKKYV